jgi:hypothetical protein
MRTVISMALAFGCLLLLAGPVGAHSPTGGSVREYAPGTVLTYRYGATGYPAWAQSAIQAALGPDWSSAAWNNTRMPSFQYSTAGSGTVYYSSSASSPCGTGNTQWLQCASGWGSSGWRIYVRNFSGAPYGKWTWCNIAYTGTCWDAERALVHEAEHVTLGIGNHDSQGEANTVMGSVSPAYASTGWNTRHIQRCDQAAGQLRYGMGSASGQLADCFDHVTGHGVVGLVPSLRSNATTLSVCRAASATLAGSFGVSANSSYGALSGQVLAGRTIWFDRKPHTSSTWTLNVASASTTTGTTNWTRSFTSGTTSTVTYDFRPHAAQEAGLDAAAGAIITVTWGATC